VNGTILISYDKQLFLAFSSEMGIFDFISFQNGDFVWDGSFVREVREMVSWLGGQGPEAG
jgi:hypothetical protein